MKTDNVNSTSSTKKNSTNTAENSSSQHNLTLKNRKHLEIDGVKEVISYDENKIVLQTNLGSLNINGENLNIQKLNLDQTNIKVSGTINNLQYSNKSPHQKNISQRIFK